MNTPFAVRQDGKFSVEEYFALIESRPEEERWQLIDGVAMMMPPPTRVHQLIASNLAVRAQHAFSGTSARAVRIAGSGPDRTRGRAVPARSGRRRARRDWPTTSSYVNKFYLVAEILSDSNTDKDIAVKRQRYLQHPDNLYFLLIEQKRVRVEVLARRPAGSPWCSTGSMLRSIFPNSASA